MNIDLRLEYMVHDMQNNFCSSPWFHIRIDPAGNFSPCRWSSDAKPTGYNIATTTINEFMNSDIMNGVRTALLNGNKLKMCSSCHYEDDNNKVSGRQKQLLKSAITINNFNKTFCSSPHFSQFDYSHEHQGATRNQPVDLQIDLGNTCNSACIMCSPTYSSKLATEYPLLNKQEPLLFKEYTPFKNWSDNLIIVDKFVAELATIPNVRYIHFLGGETLYLKSFYLICNKLIEMGISKDISIGTTTNCTVYTPELEDIIRQFKHVHLGLSIEALHEINDYVRYPASIDNVVENIETFLKLREETGIHIALRITPNVFTIYHIDRLFRYMLDHDITAESCNILAEPSCLRIEILPTELLYKTLDKVEQVINEYKLKPADSIINRRSETVRNAVISNIIFEYKVLLENIIKNPIADIEEERYNLVKFINAFESTRNNCILEYLPEYEEFLRSYGYTKQIDLASIN